MPSHDTRLDEIFAAYEARAATDPRFSNFRVEPRVGDAPWPEGWFPSNAVSRLVERGGWWPGEWNLGTGPAPLLTIEQMLDVEWGGLPEGDVMWVTLGTIWQHDAYGTPLMREPHDTAPIAVVEGQSLASGVVFPDEASLLETFLTAVDTGSEQAELLADWLINGPVGAEAAEVEAAQRELARIQMLGSDHPMWVEGMPLYIDSQMDEDLVDLVLGRER